jgi:CBS domain-containing protein
MNGRLSVWVVDEAGCPTGWIDADNLPDGAPVKDVVVQGDPGEIYVTGRDTLREALSLMLGLGFKSLPVVDDKGRFAGELSLGDIEAATSEVESADHY